MSRLPAGLLGGASGNFAKTARSRMAIVRTPLRKFAILVAICVGLVLPMLVSPGDLRIITTVQVAVIATVAMTLLVGTAGQLSIAGAGFMAVGAFTGVILQDAFQAPFLVVALMIPLAGAVCGAVLALPALRLRGLYLVLATLGFHYLISYLTREYEASRGAAALSGLMLNPPELDMVNWGRAQTWYYILIVADILVTLLALNLLRSRFGRAWIAVRERDIVAVSLGIQVGVYKILAFAVTGAILALAGALASLSIGIVSSEYFSTNLAIQLLVMAVIGGLGSILGAWLGAIFVIMLPHVIKGIFTFFDASASAQLDVLAPLQLILFGAITIAFLLFEPAGLTGIWHRIRQYFQSWPLSETSKH